jgi:hypothetical protein
MKALSIRQPWVHAIPHEGKDIENRSWQRNFRGWLAFHASAQPDRNARFPRGHRLPDLGSLNCSAICGVARVVKIITKSRSNTLSGVLYDNDLGVQQENTSTTSVLRARILAPRCGQTSRTPVS